MSTNAERAAYLQEHLCYELLMMRHTFEELTTPKNSYLDWNAYFESFAVHARNLYDFLTNDGGCNNFKARDFDPQFKASKLDNVFSLFNSGVFHLGKSRPTEEDDKINVCRAAKVRDWIEQNFSAFKSNLNSDHYPWDGDRASPSKMIRIALNSKNMPTTTNSTYMTLSVVGR
jgi:hypothetical protein